MEVFVDSILPDMYSFLPSWKLIGFNQNRVPNKVTWDHFDVWALSERQLCNVLWDIFCDTNMVQEFSIPKKQILPISGRYSRSFSQTRAPLSQLSTLYRCNSNSLFFPEIRSLSDIFAVGNSWSAVIVFASRFGSPWIYKQLSIKNSISADKPILLIPIGKSSHYGGFEIIGP
jgi:hypothetical protein